MRATGAGGEWFIGSIGIFICTEFIVGERI